MPKAEWIKIGPTTRRHTVTRDWVTKEKVWSKGRLVWRWGWWKCASDNSGGRLVAHYRTIREAKAAHDAKLGKLVDPVN